MDLAKWLEENGKYEELIQTLYEGGIIKESGNVDAKTKLLAETKRERDHLMDQKYASRYGTSPSPKDDTELERRIQETWITTYRVESELIQDIEHSLADVTVQQLRILLNEQLEKAQEFDNTHVDEKRHYLTPEYRDQAQQLHREIEETKHKLVSALLQTPEVKERFKGIRTFRDYLNKVCTQYRIPLYSDQGLEFPARMSYEEVKEMVHKRSAEASKSEVEQPGES